MVHLLSRSGKIAYIYQRDDRTDAGVKTPMALLEILKDLVVFEDGSRTVNPFPQIAGIVLDHDFSVKAGQVP